MTVQVALFKGRSLISRLIRWQTRSEYSHAALWLPETEEVIEAWHRGGVRRGPIHNVHTPGTEVDIFSVDLPLARSYEEPLLDQYEDRMMQFATKQVGGRYSFRSVFRFLSRRSAEHRPGIWFCSELVTRAFRIGGASLLERIPSEHVSPALLSYSPLLKFDRTIITHEGGFK